MLFIISFAYFTFGLHFLLSYHGSCLYLTLTFLSFGLLLLGALFSLPGHPSRPSFLLPRSSLNFKDKPRRSQQEPFGNARIWL